MDRIVLNGIEYVRADKAVSEAPKRIPQPKMIEQKCKWCRGAFMARAADVKRGWGLYCSKSCKASRQEKRTGQYRQLETRDTDRYGPREFTDAHLFSNEDHDCNKD